MTSDRDSNSGKAIGDHVGNSWRATTDRVASSGRATTDRAASSGRAIGGRVGSSRGVIEILAGREAGTVDVRGAGLDPFTTDAGDRTSAEVTGALTAEHVRALSVAHSDPGALTGVSNGAPLNPS